jgi:hypothetical protein
MTQRVSPVDMAVDSLISCYMLDAGYPVGRRSASLELGNHHWGRSFQQCFHVLYADVMPSFFADSGESPLSSLCKDTFCYHMGLG